MKQKFNYNLFFDPIVINSLLTNGKCVIIITFWTQNSSTIEFNFRETGVVHQNLVIVMKFSPEGILSNLFYDDG